MPPLPPYRLGPFLKGVLQIQQLSKVVYEAEIRQAHNTFMYIELSVRIYLWHSALIKYISNHRVNLSRGIAICDLCQ